MDNDEFTIHDDPTSYNEAILDIDFEKWLEAMNSEIDSMFTNQVMNLVDPPERIRSMGCNCVFRKRPTWMAC